MSDTLTITRTAENYPGETQILDLWAVAIDGERIAELWVDQDTGDIANVWTRNDHRGQGHASALYRQAASEIAIYHAPPSHRTDDGARFAESVGGPSMPDCTTCCAEINDFDDEEEGNW